MKIAKLYILVSGLFAALSFLSPNPLSSQEAISPTLLKDPGTIYSLTPRLEVYRDHTSRKQLEEIRALPDSAWKVHGSPRLNFGYGDDYIWVRFRVLSPESRDWWLISESVWLDYIDLYRFREGILLDDYMDGDAVSAGKKLYAHRFPVFPLAFEGGKEYSFYLRIRTITSRMISMQMMSRTTFFEQEKQESILYGVLVGLIFLVSIANIGLAISNRSLLPLLYIVSFLFYNLYQAQIAGFLLGWFAFMEQDFNDRAGFVFGCLTFLSFIQLWRGLVLTRIHAPRLDRVLLALSAPIAICLFLICLPNPSPLLIRIVSLLIMILFFPFIILQISTALIAKRKGYKPAIYSIWAGLTQCTLIAIFILMMTGPLKVGFSPGHVLWIGALADGLLFLLSLSRRFKFSAEIQAVYGQKDEKEALDMYEDQLRVQESEERYRKSKIKWIDLEKKLVLLEKLMEIDHIYRDEELSLESLGKHLELKPSQVSELLNKKFQKGFHRFVNEYRVTEASRLLVEEPSRNILSIGLDAGFNSKSSFNTEFKRITGETPSAYRKALRKLT